MDSTIPLPKGTRLKCVSHSGSDSFWEEYNTPEIGEVVTVKCALKGNGKYYHEFYEYSSDNSTTVMFDLIDFEPYNKKIIVSV